MPRLFRRPCVRAYFHLLLLFFFFFFFCEPFLGQLLLRKAWFTNKVVWNWIVWAYYYAGRNCLNSLQRNQPGAYKSATGTVNQEGVWFAELCFDLADELFISQPEISSGNQWGGFPVMAETTRNHIFSKQISQVIFAAMVLAPNFYWKNCLRVISAMTGNPP